MVQKDLIEFKWKKAIPRILEFINWQYIYYTSLTVLKIIYFIFRLDNFLPLIVNIKHYDKKKLILILY